MLALPAAGLAAEPASVQPGLWEVKALTTFERLGPAPTAVPSASPDLPRTLRYHVCISPERARSPMLPARLPTAAELLFDAQGLSGSYTEKLEGVAARQVEFSYRRLGATAFEGSHDAQGAGRAAHTQYFAQRVAAECGALKPTPPQASGEP